jgi:hypothetical protein
MKYIFLLSAILWTAPIPEPTWCDFNPEKCEVEDES